MNVRFNGIYCECGWPMLYLDAIDGIARRRIACSNSVCEHFREEYLEPVFAAAPAR